MVEVLEVLGFVVEAHWDLFQVLQFTDDGLTVNPQLLLQDGELSAQPGVFIMQIITDLVQDDDGLVFFVDQIQQLFLLLSPLQ